MTATTPGIPTTPVTDRRDRMRGPGAFLAAMAREVLILDAGMGTRLQVRGLDLRHDDPCLWNLDHPGEVLSVHGRDAGAGCRACLTNTFGANRAWLARFGRLGDLGAINRAGVELARRAFGPSGFVLGDIGPSAALEAGAAAEQADILVDAGVDALILETFEAEAAAYLVSAIRSGASIGDLPVLVSLWRWPDATADAARRLVDAGAAAVGVNCRPLGEVLEIVRRLAGAVDCPLLVKPGVAPGDPEGRSAPRAFAGALPDLVAHNVRLIGGCCGTTEAHVAALAAARASRAHPLTLHPPGTEP